MFYPRTENCGWISLWERPHYELTINNREKQHQGSLSQFHKLHESKNCNVLTWQTAVKLKSRSEYVGEVLFVSLSATRTQLKFAFIMHSDLPNHEWISVFHQTLYAFILNFYRDILGNQMTYPPHIKPSCDTAIRDKSNFAYWLNFWNTCNNPVWLSCNYCFVLIIKCQQTYDGHQHVVSNTQSISTSRYLTALPLLTHW